MAITTKTIPQLSLAPSVAGSYVFEISDGTASYQMTLDQLVGWLTESGVLGESVSANHYGSGSPEGVVTASPGHTYVDRTNHIFYIKETGVGTDTGWIQYI